LHFIVHLAHPIQKFIPSPRKRQKPRLPVI
jgi:hypothetical protein